MIRTRSYAILFAVLVAALITVSGSLLLRQVPAIDAWAPSGGALRLDAVGSVTLADEPVAYATTVGQAQVIPPSSGQSQATFPVIAYASGAIEVRYFSSAGAACKVQLTKDGRTGTMQLPADNSTLRIPLIYGEGTYTVTVSEAVSDGRYRTIASQTVSSSGGASSAAQSPVVSSGVAEAPAAAPTQSAAGTTGAGSGRAWNIDTSNPYLTSLVDINWSSGLASVQKARSLCESLSSEKEMAQAVYSHLVGRLSYDYSLVGKLPSGYTPSMDPTYSSRKGICYDIASLYAGMMRSVGVQCKLVTGYNTMVDGYHAWNEVYYDGGWHRVDLTIDCQLREYGSTYSFSSPKGSVTVKKSY